MNRLDKFGEILDSYDEPKKSAEWLAREREYVGAVFPGFTEENITKFCAMESEQLKEKLCYMKKCSQAGQEGPITKSWYDDAVASMLDNDRTPSELEEFADDELDALK